MDFLGSGSGLLLAALGIGFVIFIHELGHFLFAKWAGVKVHTFSIGFGPVVYRKSIGETDYQLSILPFGGFVAMQEEEDGSGRSMAEKHPWWRAAILFAGVAFNLASSYLILVCLCWYGLPIQPAVAGHIEPEIRTLDGTSVSSPAQRLGIQSGDRIVSFNGTQVHHYRQFAALAITNGTEPITLVVERDGQRISLPAGEQGAVQAVPDLLHGRPRIGVQPALGNRIQAVQNPIEGLEPGWWVTAIDGEPIADPYAFAVQNALRDDVGEEVVLQLRKGAEEREVRGVYGGDLMSAEATALGLPVRFEHVMPGSAAEEAGIEGGDVVARMDGEEVISVTDFLARIRQVGDSRPVALELYRPGLAEPVTVSLTPRWDAVHQRPLLGVGIGVLRRGQIPWLPRGADNPLLVAGLEVGDVILDLQPVSDPDSAAPDPTDPATIDVAPVRVRYLRGGDLQRVAIASDAWRVWRRVLEPSIFAKFLGARPQASLEARLIGNQLTAVSSGPDGGHIMVLERPGAAEPTYVALDDDLPPSLMATLTDLQIGDWLVASRDLGTDAGLIEILRGAPQDEPTVAVVEPIDVGFSLAFRHEEVPYPLEHWYDAFPVAGWFCYDMVAQTGSILSRFFVNEEEGGVSASKSLHGPVGIFTEMTVRFEYFGFASFLKFVALLGLNLFLINLVPVPIADGGRLLMLGIEQLIRRPIPAIVVNGLNAAGFLAIVTLMLFVLGADILRVLGRH